MLLSVFTVDFLLIPYFNQQPELVFLMILGVAIGSLVPDADSPDAAIFHEKIKGVKGDVGKIVNNWIAPFFPIFGWITKYLIYKPAVFVLGKTWLKKYSIRERHRGFLHSFIGLGMAVLLTGIYLSIILVLLKLFSIHALVLFLSAYIVGAMMHLIEDSCTVTGVQFNYPFNDRKLEGKLVTRPDSAMIPSLFAGVLSFLCIGLFLAVALDLINYPLWLVTIISFLIMVLIWAIFLVFFARVKLVKGELYTYPDVKSYF